MDQNVAQLPVSHQAWAWFEKNKKQTLWVTAIVAVVGLAVWYLALQREENEVQAGQLLSDAEMAHSGFGGSTQEIAQAYLKIAAAYPKTAAGARALLLGAGTLFTQGKFADAEAQFQKFTRDYRDNPLLGQALLGIAACLEAQGKTEQAITAYRDLASRHPTDSVIPQAKFALGRLYEAQNKPELARDFYEQVERESRFSSLGNEAGVRVEELIQKHPNLAPPPPPAPPSRPVIALPPASTNVAAGTNAPVTPEKN